MPTYTGEGFEVYKTRVREYLDQIPRLSKSVNDATIQRWFNEQLIIHAKTQSKGDLNHIGSLVHNKNIENAIDSVNSFPDRSSEVKQVREAAGQDPSQPPAFSLNIRGKEWKPTGKVNEKNGDIEYSNGNETMWVAKVSTAQRRKAR